MRNKTSSDRKSLTALLLTAGLLSGALSGCVGGSQTNSEASKPSSTGSSSQASNSSSTPSASKEADGLDGGVTNKEGVPIVNKPVELKVGFLFGSLHPDMDKANCWKYTEEKTGIKTKYENAVMPNKMVFVEGALPAEESAMAKQYAADLTNCRKSTLADFITGKQDIDAGWDSYTAEMERLGLSKFVELKQKAYDIVAK